jgi:plastocyanin
MKKLYMLLFAFVFGAGAANANIQVVQVASFSFTPQTFTINVGDTVRWTLVSGTHTSTSQSVPATATGWSSPTLSTTGQTFDYKVTVAGNYGYVCSFHPSQMIGGFFAISASGITTPSISQVINAYPNPCKDKITITHGAISNITLYNMVGEKISSINVDATETKTAVELAELPAGVYFFSVMKDGAVVETRRIVKSN